MSRFNKIITTEADLETFVTFYNRGTNRRASDDLKGLFVRAFYINGLMVGGYSINNNTNLFHIGIIPCKERRRLELLDQDPYFAEVQSLWIQSHVPNRVRAEIYCKSVIDAAATKPDYILGGTFQESYRQTQMRALPMLLYSGEVEVWGERQFWWIFYGKPVSCILRLPFAVVGGWLDRRRLSFVRNR